MHTSTAMTTRILLPCAELCRSIPYILLLALTLPSCKKDDDAPSSSGGGTPPLQIFGVPIPGIFTWVEDATTIGYLQTDNLGGFVFKGTAVNTISMTDLALQDNCRVEIISRDLTNGPLVYGVNMQGTEQWWVPIDQSGELVLKQVDLGLTVTQMPDFGGYWCWIRHDKGTLNGDPVYAMESYTYPGMFWSTQGTLANGNLVKLTPHPDAAAAQGFIFR